jgi:hypothetical protein
MSLPLPRGRAPRRVQTRKVTLANGGAGRAMKDLI